MADEYLEYIMKKIPKSDQVEKTWEQQVQDCISIIHSCPPDSAAFAAASFELARAGRIIDHLKAGKPVEGWMIKPDEFEAASNASREKFVPEPKRCDHDGTLHSDCKGVDCKRHNRCCWQ